MLKNTFLIFVYNTSAGGSLLIQGTELFVLEESVVTENTAYLGGGMYLDQLMFNYKDLRSIIQNNKATFFGDDLVSTPSHLTISYNKKVLQTEQLIKTDQLLMEQVNIKPYGVIANQTSDILYLPSGQEINKYQYYDWKIAQYIPLNQELRLLPLNQDLIIQKNLPLTNCTIQSRIHNIANNNLDEPFTNNYTNLQKLIFNDSTQDYNLDHLVIYFDSEKSEEFVLQLQFSCNSVKIPIYNSEYPHNILSYHNNYFLRLNIKSLPCQLGEIKQNDSCILCDQDQGLFSLHINSQKCSIIDDTSTLSVKSAQLNIRQGFWRPYLDTIQIYKSINTTSISYCLNLQKKYFTILYQRIVKEVGDREIYLIYIFHYTSCYLGHIGSLCEQCDLYNIRGGGSFSIGSSYSCGTCEDMVKNAFLIGAISKVILSNDSYIWTLITILISVKSTLKATEQSVRFLGLKKLGIAVSLETSQSATLIKMLTNFLQILATISTFQLSIPVGIDKTISAAGNPIQTMAYSLDCLLRLYQIILLQYLCLTLKYIMQG